MELIEGKGLDKILKQKGKLAEKQALHIFKDVLKGLNFAHSKGIIHRDIKPSNILIDRSGCAKIADFGIALMSGVKRKTRTGTNVGTVWYMSPEQIEHPKQIDHRSDVYSMGIILYEMLTGRVPFDGDTDFEIYRKHIHEPPPPLSTVLPNSSPMIEEIILKSLEKNPDNRYSGCGEFLEYIEAYEKEIERE